ncbi:hypothetical protein AKJ51_00100 [candidate division MSBL1 archaeon SCGC-AAA382A20]|uniref:Transposase IS4-like domain-containing protein n=1 Tax=candidate division MSBL1 archaeon SCGC-AAA382A20 TaxID=1698280 RepID=A0A133VMT6_9EURY|nr:hypothetical protein AKJ51_00100 [candidate division MSBL1 archaeon SCGC-AAA382A20]
MLKEFTIEEINKGNLDKEGLMDTAVSFAETVREDILQKWHREETVLADKKLNEYVLIEGIIQILGINVRVFYHLLELDERFSDAMRIEHLTDLESFKDFDRKRKNLKVRLKNVSKRNLKNKGRETYVLDNVVLEVDLNKYRKGKKIKKDNYDSEFIHSTTKGTVAGFRLSMLVNITNCSLKKTNIYPIDTPKKDIWEEMVIDEIGTYNGNIKVVIADGGFFAYENYRKSVHNRIVPVINPRSDCRENLKEMLKNLPPKLEWFEENNKETTDQLVDEYKEILNQAVEKSLNYDKYKETRSKIELVFKIAKEIFGMNNLHVYHEKGALWKAFPALYLSSLFYQFLEMNEVNEHRAIELIAQKRDAW